MAKLSILKEIWNFIKHRKRYWLMPIIIILVLVGLLLILTEGSAIAPFIYTLF
jgi:competence protein ComGC